MYRVKRRSMRFMRGSLMKSFSSVRAARLSHCSAMKLSPVRP
jgi:hypothetical protein